MVLTIVDFKLTNKFLMVVTKRYIIINSYYLEQLSTRNYKNPKILAINITTQLLCFYVYCFLLITLLIIFLRLEGSRRSLSLCVVDGFISKLSMLFKLSIAQFINDLCCSPNFALINQVYHLPIITKTWSFLYVNMWNPSINGALISLNTAIMNRSSRPINPLHSHFHNH